MAVYICIAISEHITCKENALKVGIRSSEDSVNDGIFLLRSSD